MMEASWPPQMLTKREEKMIWKQNIAQMQMGEEKESVTSMRKPMDILMDKIGGVYEFDGNVLCLIACYVMEDDDMYGFAGCDFCPRTIVGYKPYYEEIYRYPNYMDYYAEPNNFTSTNVMMIGKFLPIRDILNLAMTSYDLLTICEKKCDVYFRWRSRGKWIKLPIYKPIQVCSFKDCLNKGIRLEYCEEKKEIGQIQERKLQKELEEDMRKQIENKLDDFFETLYCYNVSKKLKIK